MHFFVQSVGAANITVKGTADKDAIGVTLLVLNKGTDVKTLPGAILHI